MWPWEHAAMGYLLYSLGRRALGREPPSDGAAVALVFGSVLPDLVDKPLSWGLGWFPTGYALAHSVFVAVPLGLAAMLYARKQLVVAVVVGYWTHLLGDVLNPIRTGDPVDAGRVLWPVVEREPYAVDRGLGRGLLYVREFLVGIPGMSPFDRFLFVAVPTLTAVVWVLDGTPGTAVPNRVVRALRRWWS
jgi:hypothetical protein